ncbi:MAG TPA: hypothetical protein VFE90_24980 [Myxococcales bacterium]|jgi:hypothetical protein|nr:hypothetical protein [Myxococcales bacterium]
MGLEEPSQPDRRAIRLARLVAVAADAIQLLAAPLFGEGFASPFNDVLDLVVAAALIKLLGFHWALLPAAAAELVPALDLAPTWTAAVLLITSSRRRFWLAAAWAVAAIAVVAVVLRMRHGP